MNQTLKYPVNGRAVIQRIGETSKEVEGDII